MQKIENVEILDHDRCKGSKSEKLFYVIAVLIAMVFFIIDKGILSRER